MMRHRFTAHFRFALALIPYALACTPSSTSHPQTRPQIITKEGGDLGLRPDLASPPTEKKGAPSALGKRKPGILPVPDHLPAPMMVPTGGAPKEGYRVVIAAHGAGGRGEHHCEFWDERLPLDVWIVCPTGSLLDVRNPEGGAYFPNHRALRSELRALRKALQVAYGEQLQAEGWTYIGYSQGATMGALSIVSPQEAGEPERCFQRLILIEGGGEYWTLNRAKSFKAAGGTSVTLACGTAGCAKHANTALPHMKVAELAAYFIDAPGGGHTYEGSVAEALLPHILEIF